MFFSRSGSLRALSSVLSAALVGALLWSRGEACEEPTQAPLAALKEGPRVLDPRAHKVGRLIPDLEFMDIEGVGGRLSLQSQGAPLVIALRDVGCPLSKKYAPELKRIISEYSQRGVRFLLVNPNPATDRDAMRASLRRFGIDARCTADPEGRFVAALGARRTTDTFVLDGRLTLIYRGAIDDQYGLGYARKEPRRRYLRAALDGLLGGRRLEHPATSAPGCELARPKAATLEPENTWHGRVSRIVQRNCQECHRQGQSGPFELVTYAQVKSYGEMIQRVVGDRTMPPWFASAGVGSWSNDRSLSRQDRTALLAWIKSDYPLGDPEQAPVAPKVYEGWTHGRPDAVVRMQKPVSVPAEGVVEYKYRRMKTYFSEDRWVRAMEVRAGAPDVVHHVLVFLRYPQGDPRARNQPRALGGLRGYFAGMVPGQSVVEFPEGTAKLLPKGATLIFQVHYTPNGVATKDRTSLGLYFTKAPKHTIRTDAASTTRFSIPPRVGAHPVRAERVLRAPTRVFAFMPHMHVRGSSFRYEVVYPNGESKVLLEVPRYDFNWQLRYELREPIDLPAGARIRAFATFDNSPKNPANPNPNKTVRFGEQTYEEMMIGYYDGHRLDP